MILKYLEVFKINKNDFFFSLIINKNGDKKEREKIRKDFKWM